MGRCEVGVFPLGRPVRKGELVEGTRRRASGRGVAVLASLVVASLTNVAPAGATAPGPMGRIAFASDRDGDAEIFTADPDGTDVIQLTHNSGVDLGPSWSPDGSKIAYMSAADGTEDLWVMNADGSGQTALTTGRGCCYRPAWSPDGTKIVFDDGNDLFVMNATAGASATDIIAGTAVQFPAGPSWSPDGTTIVFDASDGNSFEIFSVPATGGVPTNLTNTNGNDFSPDWSPDGTQIAYVGYGDVGWGVVVASADMSIRTWIAGSDPGFPSWSPDGSRISYGDLGDIFTVPASGGPSTNITPASTAADGGPGWGSAPPVSSFQPDGEIALGSGIPVGQDIYNSAGTGQTASTRIGQGKSRTFVLTVGNDGNVSDTITIAGTGGSKGFKAVYLEGSTGTTVITQDVVGGTYTLAGLLPGATATFRLQVTVTTKADDGDRKSFTITASSPGPLPVLDAVRAKVRVT